MEPTYLAIFLTRSDWAIVQACLILSKQMDEFRKIETQLTKFDNKE